MEANKDIPASAEVKPEVKEQLVDGKPKIVTEKIPDDLMIEIRNLIDKGQKITNEFLTISVGILGAQKRQQDMLKNMQSNETQISQHIRHVHKKLKLDKREDYRWHFDGVGNFVGMFVQKPPEQKIPQTKPPEVK